MLLWERLTMWGENNVMVVNLEERESKSSSIPYKDSLFNAKIRSKITNSCWRRFHCYVNWLPYRRPKWHQLFKVVGLWSSLGWFIRAHYCLNEYLHYVAIKTKIVWVATTLIPRKVLMILFTMARNESLLKDLEAKKICQITLKKKVVTFSKILMEKEVALEMVIMTTK